MHWTSFILDSSVCVDNLNFNILKNYLLNLFSIQSCLINYIVIVLFSRPYFLILISDKSEKRKKYFIYNGKRRLWIHLNFLRYINWQLINWIYVYTYITCLLHSIIVYSKISETPGGAVNICASIFVFSVTKFVSVGQHFKSCHEWGFDFMNYLMLSILSSTFLS